MWNLKYDTNESIYEAETYSQTQRIDLGGMDWEFGINLDASYLYIEWINNTILLYSTGRCI